VITFRMWLEVAVLAVIVGFACIGAVAVLAGFGVLR
jgi:hypothetical protein